MLFKFPVFLDDLGISRHHQPPAHRVWHEGDDEAESGSLSLLLITITNTSPFISFSWYQVLIVSTRPSLYNSNYHHKLTRAPGQQVDNLAAKLWSVAVYYSSDMRGGHFVNFCPGSWLVACVLTIVDRHLPPALAHNNQQRSWNILMKYSVNMNWAELLLPVAESSDHPRSKLELECWKLKETFHHNHHHHHPTVWPKLALCNQIICFFMDSYKATALLYLDC